MKLLKPLFVLAVVYCILGPLLLFTEGKLLGQTANQQALPITVLAVCFFIYSMLVMTISARLRADNSKRMTGFYLINNVARLLMSVLILLVYAMFVKQNLLVFTVNLFVFYIVTVVSNSLYSIRNESNTSNTKKVEK